jgi:hypothetical protein
MDVRYGSEADISQGWPEIRGLGSAFRRKAAFPTQYKGLNRLLGMLTIRSGCIRLRRPVFLAITFPTLAQAAVKWLVYAEIGLRRRIE